MGMGGGRVLKVREGSSSSHIYNIPSFLPFSISHAFPGSQYFSVHEQWDFVLNISMLQYLDLDLERMLDKYPPEATAP